MSSKTDNEQETFAFSADNRRAAGLEHVAEGVLAPHGFVVRRIDGTMRASERERKLAPLRAAPTTPGAQEEAVSTAKAVASTPDAAATQLITNCRVLAEGVDLPAVDLVVFADPKHSHVDILQCMGRASRLAPGKEFGHILVPVGEEEGQVQSWAAAVAVLLVGALAALSFVRRSEESHSHRK